MSSNEVTRDELYVAVRQQSVKWLRGQANLNLQENKDYQITVGPSAVDKGYYVEIESLLCSTKTRLFKRGEVFMISNWTRHVKVCREKNPSKNKDDFTQMPLSFSNTVPKSVPDKQIDSSVTVSSDCDSDCSSSPVPLTSVNHLLVTFQVLLHQT